MNNKLLEYLSWVSNRKLSQTKELFSLCDNNFEKLLKVEAAAKKLFLYGCPKDKKELDEWLEKYDNK